MTNTSTYKKKGEQLYFEDKNSEAIKYFNKVVKPTDEEIKLHKNFLKANLKKNFF